MDLDKMLEEFVATRCSDILVQDEEFKALTAELYNFISPDDNDKFEDILYRVFSKKDELIYKGAFKDFIKIFLQWH
jgi:hypothetical protein